MTANEGLRVTKNQCIFILLIWMLSISVPTYAQDNTDWWFDVEVLIFKHNNAPLTVTEQFDDVVGTLSNEMGSVFEDTIIVSLTEFGRTIDQNGGSGTEHGYGSAILMAGGLLHKSKIIGDWPGLKKKNLFEGRDLASSIDARAVYSSILARVLDSDHKQIVNNAFFGANLPDMTKRIFG